MNMSDGEKLIAVMLADLLEAQGVNDTVDPAFVKNAIWHSDLWALKWQYSDIFGDDETSEAEVDETAEILNMCRGVEDSISKLPHGDLSQIPENRRQVFVGFDRNNDKHFHIATLMLKKEGHWAEFRGREMDSHRKVLSDYRVMLRVFREIQPLNFPLDLAEIKKLLAL